MIPVPAATPITAETIANRQSKAKHELRAAIALKSGSEIGITDAKAPCACTLVAAAAKLPSPTGVTQNAVREFRAR
jgi:hypothetical protein